MTTDVLAWPGTYSARDLGGLPTRAGSTTVPGRFVRSESLHLMDAEGWAALGAHGVSRCVDLRSGFEVDAARYSPAEGVERIAAPWEEGLLDDPEFAGWAADGTLSTALYYRRFLERWPARTAEVVTAVARPAEGAVLFHCARGRDRTGLLALLLLAVAEVPDEVIVAEHLATDAHLDTTGVALGHPGTDGEAALYAAAGTTAEATLTALLDDLDASSYLRAAGVADDDLDRLRRRLTEA